MEQTPAPRCLAASNRLLLLIHSPVRCQGLALMKIELQTHPYLRPESAEQSPVIFTRQGE